MTITVTVSDDAAATLDAARDFLVSRPVDHNLVHTLLDDRARRPMDGRYWIARDGERVVAAAFLSPLDFFATATPAPVDVVDALVDRIAADVPTLSGITGDAGTAARFAGAWGTRAKAAATPTEAQRLYRLGTLAPPTGVRGALRPPRVDELDLLAEWAEGFRADTGDGAPRPRADAVTHLTGTLDEGRLFVWGDGGARSMAWLSRSVGATQRVQHVYTPPLDRRKGYASAVVAAISAHARSTGASECVLYTQMSNPTSNAIYQAIGYEPVSEILRYRFTGA